MQSREVMSRVGAREMKLLLYNVQQPFLTRLDLSLSLRSSKPLEDRGLPSKYPFKVLKTGSLSFRVLKTTLRPWRWTNRGVGGCRLSCRSKDNKRGIASSLRSLKTPCCSAETSSGTTSFRKPSSTQIKPIVMH